MPRFAQSSTPGAPGLHPDDVVHLARVRGLILLAVFRNVEHVGAVGKLVEVFLSL